MADWAELEFMRLKAGMERKVAVDRQGRAAAAVDLLEAAVRTDVARWNELNPGYRRRIDDVRKLMPSGAFRVSKASFPPAAIEAVLDPESFCVTVETTSVRTEGQEQETAESHFVLAEGEKGFLLTLQSGKEISFADASRLLLEPIMPSAAFWTRRAAS